MAAPWMWTFSDMGDSYRGWQQRRFTRRYGDQGYWARHNAYKDYLYKHGTTKWWTRDYWQERSMRVEVAKGHQMQRDLGRLVGEQHRRYKSKRTWVDSLGGGGFSGDPWGSGRSSTKSAGRSSGYKGRAKSSYRPKRNYGRGAGRRRSGGGIPRWDI